MSSQKEQWLSPEGLDLMLIELRTKLDELYAPKDISIGDIGAAVAFKNIFISGGNDNQAYLSTSGWYRIAKTKVYHSIFLHLQNNYNQGSLTDIYAIISVNYQVPKITILDATGFINNHIVIDNIRINKDLTSDEFYIDIHYAKDLSNSINSNMIISSPRFNDSTFERIAFTSISDTPDNEEVICYADWLNPPMIPGVEYRTTERVGLKPVYQMIVNCGNLPSKGQSVTYFIGSERDITIDSISCEAQIGVFEYAGGWHLTMPTKDYRAWAGLNAIYVDCDIEIDTSFARPVTAIVKYVKTTD